MDVPESQPGESTLLKDESSPTASLHTREHRFTPEQRTSLKGFQVIAPGKRAGDQLDDYIRSRSPSATPPRSPTAQNSEALRFHEADSEIPSQVYSAGVPHAALDQRLGSGYYSSLQQDPDEMATREGGNTRRASDQSAPSILGQKSVDSLLTTDSNASHMSGASVKPGSMTEPGSMSLEQYRQEFDISFPGQAQDGAVEGRFSSELEKDEPRTSDIALHNARPAVSQGGGGVAIGRLTTSDSLASATSGASPRASLDRIAEYPIHQGQSISGGSGSSLFGPPSGRILAEPTDQVAMTDSAEVPHESALHQLTEALGFGAKSEEHGWAGEKRAAASQMDQIGDSHESTSAESKSTLSRVAEAVGLGGTAEGAGMEKREAAHELAELGAAHEESRDPLTGDAAEEKGLPPLTPFEQRQAAFEDGTPLGASLAKPEPLHVSKGGFADVSKSPVSVLEGNDAIKTEEVYSNKQSDIWGAVGVGAAEGAGVGVALGAAAAAAAVVAPPVTAVAAGVGAGTLVGAGAAAAFGAKTEVPAEQELTKTRATTTERMEFAEAGAGEREIPLSEFRLEKDYPVVLPESGIAGQSVPVMEADPRSEIPLSEFDIHKHYYNVVPKVAEGDRLVDTSYESTVLEGERFVSEGRPRKGHETEQVYSDEQSDIWSAVGKAAAGGVGVGAALGAATTAVVAAPVVTAVAAGVGAGGLVGAGAAAAFGAKKEVPKDGTDGYSGATHADGGLHPDARDLTPSEQRAATKIAGALAANAAAHTANPDKRRDFGDVALQATAISAWAHHPGEDAAADDEAEARRANESARARAQKEASGAATGEPMSVTIKKMLKRPEGTLFVLFAAMLAPYWLAAHIGLGSIGFFWQLIFGILTGMAAMLLYQELSLYRSRRRLRRAMDIATLGVMDVKDLRVLMNNNVPTHVSFPEFEKVGWLNKSLERMWPYINKAASKMLEETLTPILEMYKPVVLENMKIKKLTLGDVAPVITGARIRNGDKPGEVVLDVKLDWRRGKPNLYLDVNPYLTPPITAKVRDVDVVAWMRIMFAPLTGKDFPCFGAVVLSLQEEPFVDFTVGLEGTSIGMIPGLDGMIDSTIKTAVVDMLLWPSRMVFPIMEGDFRDLEFLPTGVLTVTIIEATGLMKTDIIGKSDPFIFVYVRKLKERIKRTTTKMNDLEPVWNETFEVLVEAPDIQELTLRCMDQETMADAEFIGMAKVPLRQCKPGEVIDKWVDLTPESLIEQRRAGERHVHERVRGRLHFRMRWDPYEKGNEPWRSDDFKKQEEAKRKQMEEEEKEQMKSKGKKGKKK